MQMSILAASRMAASESKKHQLFHGCLPRKLSITDAFTDGGPRVSRLPAVSLIVALGDQELPTASRRLVPSGVQDYQLFHGWGPQRLTVGVVSPTVAVRLKTTKHFIDGGPGESKLLFVLPHERAASEANGCPLCNRWRLRAS